MTWWPEELCLTLADEGFFVIRFDNRDTGRSTTFIERRHTRTDLVRALYRVPGFRPAYTLSDLADDAVGLLDHLGIPAAHVAGVSMGGMIGQLMAIEHPGRVASLVSIMSTTGGRRVGWTDPRLLPQLLAGAHRDYEHYVAQAVRMARRLGSLAFEVGEVELRVGASTTWDRGISRSGVLRQMVGVISQRDRTRALRSVHVPVTVVHGTVDRMIHPSGGRATARAVPGARLVIVPGMGHDLAPGIHQTPVSVIRSTAGRRATAVQAT